MVWDKNSLLQQTRGEVNQIDRLLVHLLGKRRALVHTIAECKLSNELPLHDSLREEEIFSHLRVLATQKGLDPHFIHSLYRLILEESRLQQQQVGACLNKNSPAPHQSLQLSGDETIAADWSKTAAQYYPLAARSTLLQAPTVISVQQVTIGGPLPVVIAGPCAVESREQVLNIAQFVKSCGAQILRGGCFKPRTSPYSFQGLGLEGLHYLHEAGKKFDLPIITEVMSPEDVDVVAEYADILQIGSRNMQNFPLLKKVGTTRRPIMLKRGFMATIDEWLSSAEYILAMGNSQVILCERGIRTFESATRNTLDISAVAVIHERSHLPIIIDPSHASGNWRYIPQLAKAAIAVGAAGIMVEVHPSPKSALSDGPQALKYPTFRTLMENIAGIPYVMH